MSDEKNESEAPSGGGMMGKLIAGSIIGVIVLIETVVAFVMAPNPDDIAGKIRAEIEAEQNEGKEDADLDDVAPADLEEVELGQFDVAIHDAASDVTYHVNCTVMAGVAKSDASEFQDLLANNEHRLRERIMIEFRSATAAELNEAGLGLIKRRILEKSNALIGKPLIRRVILPVYNYHVN